jgi:hypothetical protein
VRPGEAERPQADGRAALLVLKHGEDLGMVVEGIVDAGPWHQQRTPGPCAAELNTWRPLRSLLMGPVYVLQVGAVMSLTMISIMMQAALSSMVW